MYFLLKFSGIPNNNKKILGKSKNRNRETMNKNKMKAIEMCTNRFDLDTKTSFLDLYTKIDGGEDVSSWSSSGDLEPEVESDDDEDGNVNY